MSAASLLGLASALAVTLGTMVVAFHLLRRLQSGSAWPDRGVPLTVLKRIPLGPKQSVALVKVGERVLVVGAAEHGLGLLAELTEAEVARCATGPAAPGPGASAHGSGRLGLRFQLPWIGRIALALALALGGAAAGFPRTASAAVTAPAPAVAKGQAAPAAAAATPRLAGPVVSPPALPKVDIRLGEGPGSLQLTGTVGLVVFLGVLTLLPVLFLLMTSFTRILIVLHFLRSALGTQTAPPTQLLVAVAVLLTGVVMNPVFQEANRVALQPYFHGQITQVEAYRRGVVPFREFMLANTRAKDLAMFTELSGVADKASLDEVPTVTIVAAFVVSELRTAFQMGFVIFLPFVVVDVIVASVLMSLGMFMLPPMMVSLPFKLLLFVLADGWTLVVQNLVASFR